MLGKLEQTVAKYPGYWERWVAAASCRVASNCFCITKWTCRGMVVPDRSCVVETNVSSPLARARYCHRCRPRSQAVWGPPGGIRLLQVSLCHGKFPRLCTEGKFQELSLQLLEFPFIGYIVTAHVQGCAVHPLV